MILLLEHAPVFYMVFLFQGSVKKQFTGLPEADIFAAPRGGYTDWELHYTIVDDLLHIEMKYACFQGFTSLFISTPFIKNISIWVKYGMLFNHGTNDLLL